MAQRINKHRFRVGDLVLLIDSKGKRYLIEIKSQKGSFCFHKGKVFFSDILKKRRGRDSYQHQGRKIAFIFANIVRLSFKNEKRGPNYLSKRYWADFGFGRYFFGSQSFGSRHRLWGLDFGPFESGGRKRQGGLFGEKKRIFGNCQKKHRAIPKDKKRKVGKISFKK